MSPSVIVIRKKLISSTAIFWKCSVRIVCIFWIGFLSDGFSIAFFLGQFNSHSGELNIFYLLFGRSVVIQRSHFGAPMKRCQEENPKKNGERNERTKENPHGKICVIRLKLAHEIEKKKKKTKWMERTERMFSVPENIHFYYFWANWEIRAATECTSPKQKKNLEMGFLFLPARSCRVALLVRRNRRNGLTISSSLFVVHKRFTNCGVGDASMRWTRDREQERDGRGTGRETKEWTLEIYQK